VVWGLKVGVWESGSRFRIKDSRFSFETSALAAAVARNISADLAARSV